METNTVEKRNRQLTRKALQGEIESKRSQLQKDAKALEIAHLRGKTHPTPLRSSVNNDLVCSLEAATEKYEKTLKALADLYGQDRWGDYTGEALLTREFSTLRTARAARTKATDKPRDKPEDHEETNSRISQRSRRTTSSRSSRSSAVARREALAEAAAAKEKAEFERVIAEKENLRKQQEAEEEKTRQQQRAQHEREMAILAADKAEAVARARLKAIEEALIEEENEDELIRGADRRCQEERKKNEPAFGFTARKVIT